MVGYRIIGYLHGSRHLDARHVPRGYPGTQKEVAEDRATKTGYDSRQCSASGTGFKDAEIGRVAESAVKPPRCGTVPPPRSHPDGQNTPSPNTDAS